MLFTSIPNNYAPLYKPLIYGFAFEEARDVVEVKIIDVLHSRTLGVRRFYDVQSAEIDIAPLLKRCFDPKPVAGGTVLVDAEGFYSLIEVEVDGQRSEPRYYSPYSVRDGEGTIFRTATKEQHIARGESDYIVIYAPNGGHVYCELYAGEVLDECFDMAIEAQQGLQILKIEPSGFSMMVTSLIVNVYIEDIDDFMTYRIVDKSELSKRLMWCDTDGIVRFYTFPTCRMRHSRYDKHQVETAQGQKVLACEVDTRLSLVSDYETAEVIERLSEILESKFVWIDRGPSSVRVDVLSTESVVRYGGALNSLQIDIRPHDRKEATL